MNARLMLTTTLIIAAFATPMQLRAEEPVKTPVQPKTAAFCIDLYRHLAAEKGNIFFSPFSVATALAMTSAGAAGATDAEMAKVLHLDPDQAKRHAQCAQWAKSLSSARKSIFEKSRGGLQISTANALWCSARVKFKKPFVDIATKDYLAEVRGLDFVKNAAKAVDEINAWVHDKTHGKISRIITPDAVNPMTALILTNAIYFKGDWASPFEKETTRDADFTLDGGGKIQCSMMVQTESFPYAKRDGFAAMEMPYEGGQISMLVLLPDRADGLGDLEKRLDSGLVDGAIQALAPQKVIVYLPKFHAGTRYQLSDALQALGMKLAFTPDADFKAITDDGPLYISAVIHKAFVDVDEKGTEAAAATAVTMELASAMPRSEPPVFRADHPFIYMIRDTKSGQILFAGRMADPRK